MSVASDTPAASTPSYAPSSMARLRVHSGHTLPAAKLVAREQHVPGNTTHIEYQDAHPRKLKQRQERASQTGIIPNLATSQQS